MAVFEDRLYVGSAQGEVWRTSGQVTFSPCQRLPFQPGCLKFLDAPVVVELWSRATPTSAAWPGTEVTSLAAFGGRLFLAASGPLEIWRSADGLAWSRVAANGFGDPDNNHSGKLRVFRDQLYAGTSREVPGGTGDGVEVWRTADGFAWSAVVATGQPGALLPDGFGFPGNGATTALAVFRDRLYASTVNHVDQAQIWRFDGSAWAAVGPAFGAFEFVPRIQTLAVLGRRLFAGQGITAQGPLLWSTLTGADWGVANAGGFPEAGDTSLEALVASTSHLYVGTQDQTAGLRIWEKQPSLLDRGFFEPPGCTFVPWLCAPPVPFD
jgi:hypothetical protein